MSVQVWFMGVYNNPIFFSNNFSKSSQNDLASLDTNRIIPKLPIAPKNIEEVQHADLGLFTSLITYGAGVSVLLWVISHFTKYGREVKLITDTRNLLKKTLFENPEIDNVLQKISKSTNKSVTALKEDLWAKFLNTINDGALANDASAKSYKNFIKKSPSQLIIDAFNSSVKQLGWESYFGSDFLGPNSPANSHVSKSISELKTYSGYKTLLRIAKDASKFAINFPFRDYIINSEKIVDNILSKSVAHDVWAKFFSNNVVIDFFKNNKSYQDFYATELKKYEKLDPATRGEFNKFDVRVRFMQSEEGRLLFKTENSLKKAFTQACNPIRSIIFGKKARIGAVVAFALAFGAYEIYNLLVPDLAEGSKQKPAGLTEDKSKEEAQREKEGQKKDSTQVEQQTTVQSVSLVSISNSLKAGLANPYYYSDNSGGISVEKVDEHTTSEKKVGVDQSHNVHNVRARFVAPQVNSGKAVYVVLETTKSRVVSDADITGLPEVRMENGKITYGLFSKTPLCDYTPGKAYDLHLKNVDIVAGTYDILVNEISKDANGKETATEIARKENVEIPKNVLDKLLETHSKTPYAFHKDTWTDK